MQITSLVSNFQQDLSKLQDFWKQKGNKDESLFL